MNPLNLRAVELKGAFFGIYNILMKTPILLL